MSQFTTELKIRYVDGLNFEILEGFEYHIGTYPSEEIITVPVGFITDFASVPKIFWSILPPNGIYGKSTVIHDYLYYSGIYSKSKSDEIFLESMGVLKVPDWQKYTMYRAVKYFGYAAWNTHRKNDKK